MRERHESGAVQNELVSLPADGSTEPRVLAAGHDFFTAPPLDPRDVGSLGLWDHPRMPWDGTELWVGELGTPPPARSSSPAARRVGHRAAMVAGRRAHFCSDRTGWWNLYREDGHCS